MLRDCGETIQQARRDGHGRVDLVAVVVDPDPLRSELGGLAGVGIEEDGDDEEGEGCHGA